jgi:CheY-like chemotaxis protein
MLNMLLNKRAVVNDMAINGVESVVAVRENFDKYDVIFMDYTMPEMVRR